MRYRPLILLAPVLAAAAIAAPASAETFCVHQAGTTCPAGTVDEQDSLQHAIDDAGASSDADDVIRIGPGTFWGPFLHNYSSPTKIIGSGSEHTILTAGAGQADTVLTTGHAHVSKLRIQVPPVQHWTGALITNGGVLEDVVIDTASPDVGSRFGATLMDQATLRRSTVNLGPGDSAVGVDANGDQPVVAASKLKAGIALRTFPEDQGGTRVRRSELLGSEAAFLAEGSSAILDNSILRAGNGGDLIVASCDKHSASITGDHLSVRGPNADIGTFASCEQPGLEAFISLRNSTITGTNFSTERRGANGGRAEIAVSFSNLEGLGTATGEGSTSLEDTIDVDPGFSDTALHLAPDSPLIDAGAPGGPSFATDLDGNPRQVGERQDIGAYEFVPPAPEAPAGEQPAEFDKPPTPAEPGAAPLPEPVVAPSGQAGSLTSAALLRELKRTLRGRKGRRYRHLWLVPGTLRIKWVAGGRVIASARVEKATTGRFRLRVKPSGNGRALLAKARRVTVRGTFTPKGGAAIRAKRRAVLRRG
ncbi:MAG TPA: choice-of-anchor Q domain-containing protein [Solirubrobacteraceae bacterium]